MDKARIKRSFSRAVATYDGCGELQAEVGLKLLERIPSGILPKAVLDAGCGTGGLLPGLMKSFPGATVFGCDIAAPMLEAARERQNSARLVGSDFERFSFKNGSMDLVVSNLAYQWLTDIDKAFAELSAVLAEGGQFIMSTLGPATLMELKTSFMNAQEALWLNRTRLMTFYDVETIREAAEKAKLKILKVDTERVVKTYEDLWALLKTLKGIGATNPNVDSSTLANTALLKETARFYKALFSSDDKSGIRATYDIIYMTLAKPTAIS